LAIVKRSLFVSSSASAFALGDPVPRPIDAAIVGDPTEQARTVDAVEHVAEGSLVFGQYPFAPTCT
jgi:hypothetical protein